MTIDEEERYYNPEVSEQRRGRAHACISVFDVTDVGNIRPLSLFQVSELDSPWSRTPRSRFGAHQFHEHAGGTLLYSTWFSGGLRIIDLADLRGIVSFPSFHASGMALTLYALRRYSLVFWPMLLIFCVVYFGSMFIDKNYRLILQKADNVPITMMLLGTMLCLWIAFRQAAFGASSLGAALVLAST